MKRIQKRNLWIGLFLAIAFFHVQCFAQKTIHLTNGEWPPFMSQNLPYQGLASRIVTSAFAIQGIKVKYGWFPWMRAYKLAAEGDYNGCVGYTWSEDRVKLFFYSKPIFELKDVFFYKKDHPFDWHSFEDLKGLRIGITHGYFYGNAFETAQKRKLFTVDVAHSDKLGLRKLLAKRIDLFPLAKEIGYAMLSKYFSADQAKLFTHHPRPIRTSEYCLILCKKIKENKMLIDSFNQGLDKLKASGRYAAFYDDLAHGGYVKAKHQ